MTTAPTFDEQPQRIEPTALDTIQRAEIDLQISTAKRYPRHLGMVKQAMMSFATLDVETAESCFYSLPRGGKNIQGPSVRLAEIAVSCFGNLRVGSRVVSTVTDGQHPHVVVQSVCHDLEKNVAVTMEKRRRISKKKSKDHIDEDDISLAANAGAAIAFRDAVFKVVPMALIKPVFDQAKRVAIGDAKTLVDRRARMEEAFSKMGVTKEMILARLEKKTLDDVDLPDMEILIGLHTALKDGDTTIDEIFLPPKPAKPTFEGPSNGRTNNIAPLPPQEPPPPQPTPAPDNVPMETPQPTPPTPVPEPLPAAAEVKPKERKAKAAPAQESPKEQLINAGVSFDDFTDWCVSTARWVKAKDWPSYEDVPDAVWKALEYDRAGIAKCVVLYGKPTEPAPVEA